MKLFRSAAVLALLPVSAGLWAQNSPTITLVANAEGENPIIAPNTWVEVKGLNLSKPGDTRTWGASDFVNTQLLTALDGVSVTVNGRTPMFTTSARCRVDASTLEALLSSSSGQATSTGAPMERSRAMPEHSPLQLTAGTGPNAPCNNTNGDYSFYTFAEWQQTVGEDAQSVIQNPGFINPTYPADDYSLPKGSPGAGFV